MTDFKPILGRLAVLQAADERLDISQLAAEAGLDPVDAEATVDEAMASGLCHVSDETGVPFVTDAGRQVLDGFEPAPDVLAFLPHHVDDLRTRQALLGATQVLVEEFAQAVANGLGLAYACEIVPAAFVPALDDALAARLFAAMAAVAARLATQAPAACVAEEVMAVAFITEATSALEDDVAAERLSHEDFEAARGAMHGVFALFEDDDVLALFEMSEPADAAVAGHDPHSVELGVVDQRIEAWFHAFGGVVPTGHVVRAQPPDG